MVGIEVPRAWVQAISLIFFACGIVQFFTGRFEIGAVLTGIAFYVMIMSESIMLQKVNLEMAKALESLRKKQDSEVQELLFFLRKSKVNADPFHSYDACKTFISKLGFPSFLMSPTMGIIKANKQMTDLLGYKLGELDGTPAARINDKIVMSEVGGYILASPCQDVQFLSMRYVYVSKVGERILGTLDVTKIVDGAFLMVFHPDKDLIVTEDGLKNIMR